MSPGGPAAPGEPAVARGMQAQLGVLRGRIDAGAERVGWKVGLNLPAVQQRLGIATTVVGHLTSDTRLDPLERHSLAGTVRPAAEPEIAAVLAADVAPGSSLDDVRAAIGHFAPAIEIVDVDLDFDDVEPIVAGNVFHRGFLVGTPVEAAAEDLAGIGVRVSRNGSPEHEVSVADGLGDPARVLSVVAERLGQSGELLRAGDTVICGSLTPPLPVAPGDLVEVDYGRLGELGCGFS
jgi:2-keto-4-pentenoate hydratase